MTASRPAFALISSISWQSIIDCVPIAGDTPPERGAQRLAAVYSDTAMMSYYRLSKPLSVRVLPVPGKKAGEMTNFSSASPWLVDATIFEVK